MAGQNFQKNQWSLHTKKNASALRVLPIKTAGKVLNPKAQIVPLSRTPKRRACFVRIKILWQIFTQPKIWHKKVQKSFSLQEKPQKVVKSSMAALEKAV